jgi:hypothetical protein
MVGFAVTALVPSASTAAVYKVGPGGTHATVQAAVNAAVLAGGPNEVRIAAGTFTGRVSVPASMVSGELVIEGGWNASFSIRSDDPSLTVLNGGGGGSAVAFLGNGGSVSLQNLTVTGGRAADAAGVSVVALHESHVSILDCRIVGNEAAHDTNSARGGGLHMNMSGTSVGTVARTVISGNSAKSAHFGSGAGVNLLMMGNSRISFQDNVVTANTLFDGSGAGCGSGLAASVLGAGILTMTRNLVARNSGSTKAGAAVYGAVLSALDDSQIALYSNAFLDNVGLETAAFTSLWLKASDTSEVWALDSVVAGGNGGGVKLSKDSTGWLAITNCTIANHPGAAIAGNVSSLFNTIVVGTGGSGNVQAASSGGNLLTGDPQFVNAALHDYRLRPGSPAINAGVASPPGGLSSKDFSGRTRVVGGKVDIGAHEYPGTTTLAAAALAHTLGFNNTPWRSDLDLHNAGAGSAALTAHYITSTGTQTKPVTLSAGETRAWHDVLFSLFGVNASAKTSGSLEIEDPTGAVAGVVRTYADGGAAGTYGQGYPQLGEHDGLSAGDTGIMPIVKSNAKFYSNIGIQNLGTARGEARVTLYGQNGLQLGTPVMIAADPGCWAQSSDVFAKAGVQGANVAYARLKALTAGVRVWGAASVIDRSTKDPTTVEAVEPVAAGTVLRVASVAHAAGFGGTPWRSTVAVVNSEESAGKVTLTFRGASTIVKTVQLGGRAALEWADVLVELFGVGVGDTASGALEVVATRKVVVASRTYADRGAAGTYGQSYPALTNDRGVWAGTTGVLLQLRKNAKTYTNIGALNLSSVPCAGSVQLLDDQGHAIGSPLAIATAAGGWTQISDAFLVAGAGGADAASARVTTVTEGCSLWYYASVIDSLTRDPTTVELSRPLEVEPTL